MADANEYVLTINIEGGGGSSSKALASNSKNLGGSAGQKGNGGGMNADAMIIGVATFGIAQGYKYYAHQANQVQLETGSARLQEKAQLNYNIQQRILQVATSAIAGGITTGSPYGAIAGATMSLVNQVIDISRAQEDIRLAQNVENVSRAFANIRIGADGGRQGKNANY